MSEESTSANARGEIAFSRPASDTLVIHFGGAWLLKGERPPASETERELAQGSVRRVAFDTRELREWDTGILTFLSHVLDRCRTRQINTDRTGLPPGVRRLLDLAEAVPEKEGARSADGRKRWLERIGLFTIDAWNGGREFLAFVGAATVAAGSLLRLRARFRISDLFLLIQECGAAALPIVTLISFLFGLILAFMGAVQLRQFGAAIYVADLVGLAMAREMGAVMTGIIMAGRTGAAFAAQLGTMKVTEEIDALTTMGISPMEFLVLPRMIALFLMMPLLCVYADLIGILGGAVVGVGMLDLSPTQYFRETSDAIALKDFVLGVVKSGVFGILIALSGCLRGMQCGNSASAVGDAATSAVVTSIVFLIATDGLFAVLCNVLGV
jgi:phospholipid/cholesterol/gamma-HCH transport system permease protein